MTDTKRLSLHGRLRMAAACPDPNASLLAEAADAIEQHEAFRKDVSDAVESLCNTVLMSHGHRQLREMLSHRFIIAKPDPLVEALQAVDEFACPTWVERIAPQLRAALAARGLKIVEDKP